MATGHLRCARRFLILRVLLLLLLPRFPVIGAAPPGSTSTNDEAPLISIESRLVVFHASVRDRNGEIVPGLLKSNFAVDEDGRRQAISVFQEGDAPVAVGLVVDNSTSMHTKRAAVVAAALEFVLSSNPHDQMFIIHFNEQVRFGLADAGAFSSFIPELKAALESATPGGETALYDAIAAGLIQLRKSDCERKVLIVISDGGDNASHHRLDELLLEARRGDAAIYTIGLFDEDDQDRNPAILRRLAQPTGGEVFLPRVPSEVVEICRQIAKDIRTQYTIGYSPANTHFDGRFRRIRVSASGLSGEPLVVRTRAGYFAAEARP